MHNQEIISLPAGSIRIPADLSTVHSDGFLIRTEEEVSEIVVYWTREIRNVPTADPPAITAEALVRVCMEVETLMRLSEGLQAVLSEFVLTSSKP
jgi:hypothetical protein